MLRTDAMSIRWLLSSDVPVVARIEQQCFALPLTETEIMEWLAMQDCIGLVYEARGRIAAYMIYVFDDLQYYILNMAVAPEFRFQGVATELVRHLKLGLVIDRRRIRTKVREDNVPAIRFFEKHGFITRPDKLGVEYVHTGKKRLKVLHMKYEA